MVNENIEVLKLIGNKVNVRIITLLRMHPTSPRDLSRYLNKKEGDIVRRLKAMEKYGLVKGSWGSRLGQNVKLYSLVTREISVTLKQDGLQIAFGKDKKTRKNLESAVMSVRSNVYDDQEQQQPREEFDMVGRASELKLVRESKKANFFFIIGIAGIGKTSFAKKYVQGSAITKEKVFWHTFKEIDTFPYVMSRLALFLSKQGADDLVSQLDLSAGTRIEESESHSLEILIESLNKVKGCILVFDDFHKVRDEKISVLLRHIQAKLFPATKTLVLSRSKAPFFLDNVHGRELVLGGLTFADSEKMISHFGANINDTALLEIWKRFAGHPMALKLFCMLVKESLKNDGASLSPTSRHQTLSIEELLAYFKREILEVLSQDELSILMSLSVFRCPVKIQAINLGGSKKRNLNYLIYSLEKKMLVNRSDIQEFFVHDMLKDVLYSMLAYPEETHAAAANHYLSEQTAQNTLEAMYHLLKAKDLHKVISIVTEEVEQERYRLLEEGYSGPLLEILSHISLSSVTDKKSLVYLLNIEGKAYALMEKWEEAKERLDQAWKIAEKLEVGNSVLIAHTKRILGEALYLKGEFTLVEKHLLEAASIFKNYQMQEHLKGIYLKLGRMYFATGRPEKSQYYSDLAMAASTHQT